VFGGMSLAWKIKDPTPAPPLEGRGYEHGLLHRLLHGLLIV